MGSEGQLLASTTGCACTAGMGCMMLCFTSCGWNNTYANGMELGEINHGNLKKRMEHIKSGILTRCDLGGLVLPCYYYYYSPVCQDFADVHLHRL
jgi:hypothetical protein